MKKLTAYLVSTVFCLLSAGYCYATPSTQIWNPSTDIQGTKTLHLGIDNYFSVFDNKTKPVNVPTDVNLTVGAFKNLEIGFDYFGASADPLQFNAKYGLPEGDKMPAIAVGVMNIGTKTDSTNYDISYVVLAKTFKHLPRLSVGYYIGNSKLLVDENGIDIAYSCTQKGLSCPPGLSPITVSPRAVEWLQARKLPVPAYRIVATTGQAHWEPLLRARAFNIARILVGIGEEQYYHCAVEIVSDRDVNLAGVSEANLWIIGGRDENLIMADLAMHEYVGLFVYRLSGRSS